MRFDKTVYREMSKRQKSVTAKCPYGEVSLRRSVFTTKCSHGEMTLRWSVSTVKFPYNEVSVRWNVQRRVCVIWDGSSYSTHLIEKFCVQCQHSAKVWSSIELNKADKNISVTKFAVYWNKHKFVLDYKTKKIPIVQHMGNKVSYLIFWSFLTSNTSACLI